METKLSILFYSKTSKKNKDGLVPIYLRVTINGVRFEQTTQRYISPEKWSVDTGHAKGNTEEARSVNSFLDALKQRVYTYQKEIIMEGLPVDAANFRIKWLGIKEKVFTLLEVFKKHNDQMFELIGSDCSKATHGKYKTTYDHTKAFLEWKYQLKDIEVQKLTYNFMTEFEFYLKSKQKCNHNTTIKYLSNLKKIVGVCIKNGWVAKDPFFGFKMSKKEVVRQFLTQEEIQVVISKDFGNDRLNQVRDIFVFSCYTGLAYIDAQRLKRADIGIGMDGEKWLFTNRKKTDSPTRVPLLPPVIEILNRYATHPTCISRDCLLPVPSNVKLNAYLKEVADICGINKHLTFHIARHTFATTVTLNNGVPIETVSQMLGHKSIKVTQLYAKILDRRVSNDMNVLRNKFAENTSQKKVGL
jgi:site-specific recombinase XerD